jgi:hypothetical protein
MEFSVSLTLVKCSPPASSRRIERRTRPVSLSAATRLPPAAAPLVHNLGTFEGERKRRCTGYDESYGVTKSLLSLLAVASVLFVIAVTVGAV